MSLRSNGHRKQGMQRAWGFLDTGGSTEKKGAMGSTRGADMEGGRHGDTHHKSDLQLPEDLSGYSVERNGCVLGCEYSRRGRSGVGVVAGVKREGGHFNES